MIGIALRFPAGRFHATPWGRHVNEGVPEWPPSPWRLLRALVATWKAKVPEIDERQVRGVLEQLLGPPSFLLPAATTGHARYYMPLGLKKKEGTYIQNTTLVFDAFVSLDRNSDVAVIWPNAELGDDQREILSTLLDCVGYLGRAESWCEARLLADDDAKKHLGNADCRPLNGNPPGEVEEIVRVLAPDPESGLQSEHVQPEKGRSRKKKRPAYDPAWHLCIETAQLHSEKWSDPPGSRWVPYIRRCDCFDPPPKPRKRPQRSGRYAQAVRFALDSSVLPLVTETLPIAEHVRRKLMGIFGRITERDGIKGKSAILSGKDADGQPLKRHRHAYYLPTDEDGDGRLDHLTIVAEAGFNRDELRALDRMRTLKRGEEVPMLNLLMLGWGPLGEITAMPLRKTNEWVSVTPFLVTRHPKKNGRKRDPQEMLADSHLFVRQVLREEVGRLLQRRENGNPEAVTIEPLYDESTRVYRVDPKRWIENATGPKRRPIEFKRYRNKRSDDGGRRRAGTFRIRFPQDVKGPISLGHSSHFGLGLFLPSL